MYHVFSNASPSAGGPQSSDGSEPRSKKPGKEVRPKSTRSCAECRRRRIRCDGDDSPCGQCKWYKVVERCYYPTRRQRTVPSLEAFNTVSVSLKRSNEILNKLFPSTAVESLASLSRQELVKLVLAPKTHDSKSPVAGEEDTDEALECLEPSPQQEFQFDESTRNQDPASKVFDDVNGLSLALDDSSSYLGISSISAVLRVINHIAPDFRSFVQQSSEQSNLREISQNRPSGKTPSRQSEQTFIDGYFEHIHCITPIVDEAKFRARYARGDDHGSPWLALMNMLLAMGSICISTRDENSHTVFYNRAYQHLSLDSLGNGNLETVQALALLGGYYCHFLNRPNMANVVMGAALRMAIAMGLHREERSGSHNHSIFEIRRRVWWCLFCLDSWASFALGRPSLGRWDPETITAALPTSINASDISYLSLRASVDFCKIGTAVQDRLARLPLISCEEILTFDGQVQQWHAALPAILKRSDYCPHGLLTARGLMNMRYQNLRLILYKPRLLTTTVRKVPVENLLPEEKRIVDECRHITSDIVADIAKDWFPIQLCVRNSAWFLFNGCLVPLLGLFSHPNHEDVPKWQHDIEVSLGLFEEFSDWTLTERRTRDVVSTIYAASKNSMMSQGRNEIQVAQEFSWDPSTVDNFLWDDMDWSSIPGFNEFNFDATDYGAINYFSSDEMTGNPLQ